MNNLALTRQQKDTDSRIHSMLTEHSAEWRKKINAGSLEALVERRKIIFSMRRVGLSYDDISTETGLSKSVIREDVKAVLEEYRAEMISDAHLLIVQELDRLDKLQEAFWEKAMQGSDKAGKIVLDVMKQRMDLLGLQADNSIEKESTLVEQNTLVIQYVDDWRSGQLPAPKEPEKDSHIIDIIPTDKW